MGVAGSGKTTIGQLLSAKTGYAYFDADDFHPQQNKDKMQAGVPLNDEDRQPWLHHIHSFVLNETLTHPVIFGCSALKENYRTQLSEGIKEQCHWIFLNGDFNIIAERLGKRTGHYMAPSLLQSQFDALEKPPHVIEPDIRQSPENIVDFIMKKLKLTCSNLD